MGDGDALIEVGRRYYAGQGVKRNQEYAVDCFRTAIRSKRGVISEAGRESAMLCLGMAYQEGLGLKRSDAKALYWLSKANLNKDNPTAQQAIKRIRIYRASRQRH